MKNTKSKIELMENEINSKARKAYATTVARRDAERCGDIPVTCTPAVAAVKPMRGELAQEPYTPEQVLNNLKIIREDLRDFPMSLDGGPGYARYIADSIIERGILGAETLEAKFAAGWQKSIEAGSVRLELADLRKFIQSVAASSNGSRMVSQNCLAASQILESAIIERGELLAALEDIVTAIPPIGELELRDRISTINGIAREAIARARGQ
jgi:hypothetical protein